MNSAYAFDLVSDLLVSFFLANWPVALFKVFHIHGIPCRRYGHLRLQANPLLKKNLTPDT